MSKKEVMHAQRVSWFYLTEFFYVIRKDADETAFWKDIFSKYAFVTKKNYRDAKQICDVPLSIQFVKNNQNQFKALTRFMEDYFFGTEDEVELANIYEDTEEYRWVKELIIKKYEKAGRQVSAEQRKDIPWKIE